VVDYVGETRGNVRLPGIMMLGFVAAHSENLAMAVIVSKVTTINTSTCLTCVVSPVQSSHRLSHLCESRVSSSWR
jgi:hypothetical protein